MAGDKVVKIGIGVLIFKNGKVLLGKRKDVGYGKGEYAGPGGHLEFGESFANCAKRECREEAGIEIGNIRFLSLTNIKKYSGLHYVDIGLLADWKGGTPEVLEPTKLESWGWYDLDNLPKPLFEPVKHYLQALKTGQTFFDE